MKSMATDVVQWSAGVGGGRDDYPALKINCPCLSAVNWHLTVCHVPMTG